MLAACGGGTDAPGPATIEIVSGDGQQAPRGTVLAQPVVVRVLGGDNQPFAGAVVAFTSLTDVGFSVRDTTDAAGLAQASWVLGSSIGGQSLRAEVTGVAPLTISAVSVDPCLYNYSHTFGTSVTATLQSIDCVEFGAFIDYYGFTFPANAVSGVFRTTASFDAFMQLEDMQGNIIAFNDDDGVTLNSSIRAFLVPNVQYRAGPTSFLGSEVGPYLMSSALGPADLAACLEAWTVRGVTLTQQVTNNDCLDTATGKRSDALLFIMHPGQSATVTLRSTALDAFLTVLIGGQAVTTVTDDNSGGGTDAQIMVPAPLQPTLYLVDAGSVSGGPGAYTLTITPTGSAAPPAVAAPAVAGQLRAQRTKLAASRTQVRRPGSR